jgi:hypothetical protein
MLLSLNAYNIFFRYREFCEMKPIKYWTDLYGLMPNHTILAYSRIYEDPEVSSQRTVAQDFSRTHSTRDFNPRK